MELISKQHRKDLMKISAFVLCIITGTFFLSYGANISYCKAKGYDDATAAGDCEKRTKEGVIISVPVSDVAETEYSREKK